MQWNLIRLERRLLWRQRVAAAKARRDAERRDAFERDAAVRRILEQVESVS